MICLLISKLRSWQKDRLVERKLIKLTGAVEKDYIRDFVNARLLPALQRNLTPTIEEGIALDFLATCTPNLEAICVLTRRGFGEAALVLARTLFEHALYLAYIYQPATATEVTARARSWVFKALTDQKQWRAEMAKLKAKGKCLSLERFPFI